MTELGPMEQAFAKALKDFPPSEQDKAAAQLAHRYAQLIDGARGSILEHEVVNDLGPKYLAVLTALGMTVAGRGVKGGATNAPGVKSALAQQRDELAARRAKRAG